LLRIVAAKNRRRPDDVAPVVGGLPTPVDFVYRTPVMPTAVVLDDPAGPDRPDPTGLMFLGWNVIHVHVGDDLERVIAENATVFGEEIG